MRYGFLFSTIVIAFMGTGCAGTGRGGMVGKAAPLFTLPDLDDNEVFLGSLLQDRVDTRVREDRADEDVDSTAYLLLVNSNSTCDLTPDFMKDLLEAWDGFEKENCRCALVIEEKPGAPAEAWKEFARDRITLFRDPEGACLEQYVRNRIPALTLINRSGVVVFHCEGYLAPETLLKKIRSNDFSSVNTESG
jgi:hypothetical protein